jgi:hypothetical protein
VGLVGLTRPANQVLTNVIVTFILWLLDRRTIGPMDQRPKVTKESFVHRTIGSMETNSEGGCTPYGPLV